MRTEPFQLFPVLDGPTEAALRASIERHGVIVPVVRDQHGRIIDGYHRSRIADELSVSYPVSTIDVADDEHATELAQTLNTDRRHLSPDQRRELVIDLRAQGHSERAIAGALGVGNGTVHRDLAGAPDGAPQPESVRGADGKTYPARRPAPAAAPPAGYLRASCVQSGYVVVDSYGEARTIDRVEEHDGQVILHDDDGGALIIGADMLVEVTREGPGTIDTTSAGNGAHGAPIPAEPRADRAPREQGETAGGAATREGAVTGGPTPAGAFNPPAVDPPITKPDLGGGLSHPARFSDALLPVFAKALPPELYPTVVDPFAGTGRIHELSNQTVGVELEPEWAAMHPDTICGSALNLPFPDDHFDAVCTSPCYGNRLADHHNAADPHLRRSYTHDLGRPLSPDNAGAMQWGNGYRKFHWAAWEEMWRVLRPGGRLVLNIKDHVRGGVRQHVAGWHVMSMFLLGLELTWCEDVHTSNLRQGENGDLRFPEQVFVFDKRGGS